LASVAFTRYDGTRAGEVQSNLEKVSPTPKLRADRAFEGIDDLTAVSVSGNEASKGRQ